MMPKIATRPLPEALEILDFNGIDVNRVIKFNVECDVNDRVTRITVTMLALNPEDAPQP